MARMELRHLRYFVKTAEEGNVSRAAGRLHVSQPAVSRQLRDLEEELGTPLFLRQHDGIQLTDAGRFILPQAQEILRQAEALKESVRPFSKTKPTTILRVGYLPTALPGFLAEGLRAFNPQDRGVRIEINEMSPQQQEVALANEDIELALLGHACPELKQRYRIEAISTTRMAIALPDDHPLAKRRSLDLSELGDETFLTLHERHFPGRPELMSTLFRKAKITPHVSLKADGLTELLGQVGGGLGIALIPADVESLPHPRVGFVRLRRPQVSLVFSAAWHPQRETQALVEFVQILKQARQSGSPNSD